METKNVSTSGVLSDLSNLSDLQNASQVAVNQQDQINVDGYLTCHIDTSKLPKILQQVLSVSNDHAIRDMLFLSSLTALSYACPKYWTLHGKPGKKYHANLMTMILAPAASGKGVMTYTKRLLRPIHEALNEHRLEGSPKKMTFVPCNTTASAFIKQVGDNGGSGFLFANEMDTLSQMWKSSYGKFSDVLRCCFEHEAIGMRRRTNNEYVEIEDPRLSVLVSGTYKQYWQSLPDTFSRVEAMQLADDYGINQVTATRWIGQYVEAGEAIRVSQGHYKKGV